MSVAREKGVFVRSLTDADENRIVSPAYFVFDFRIANHAYGEKLLRSKPYVAHFGQASDGVRVGQWDLSMPGMRQIPVLLPPPDEQAAIVRFLDWANGRLERAIRAKRKVITLLNEQKPAIIHHAVTRGFDPSVRIKPPGVPWIGEITGHWEVSRVKNEFRCLNTFRVPLNSVERGEMTNRTYDYYGASGVINKVDNYLYSR